MSEANPHPVNVLHINADQLPVAYEHFGPGFFANRYNIGVWHWELPEFPDIWSDSLELVDEIWAPTRFIRDSLSAVSPVPVVHMPHAVTIDPSASADRTHFGLPVDAFLFLMMFDMHSFQARKNPEAAVEAFQRALQDDPSRDMGLVIKVMNAATSPRDLNRLRDLAEKSPKIHLLETHLSRRDAYRLQASCDAFVSLHRSEGFGLGLAESMAIGKPALATAWSGNMDFMTTENSALVGYELAPIAIDHGPYAKGQLWAEADVNEAARWMNRLATDSVLCRRLGVEARRTIETQHAPTRVATLQKRRLDVLARYL